MGSSRTIFVANLPFDVSEEQLADTFAEAGPVQGVEIKFDQQTGRSKGYAFVQFYDEATAESAVRNMRSVAVNGRNLRVEASSDDPARNSRMNRGRRDAPSGPPRGGRDSSYGGLPPPPGGGLGMVMPPPPMSLGMGGPPPSMGGPIGGPTGPGGPVDLNMLPPGVDIGGQKATDIISKTLAAVSPGQMQDVMAGMKTLVMTQPDQARILLQSKPQLAYALFQAMLLMNIIDPSVLQRIQPIPTAQSVPPPQSYQGYPPQAQQQQQQPPPAGYPSYPPPNPPQNTYRPPQPVSAPNPVPGGYGAPPSQSYGGYPPQGVAPPVASGAPGIPPAAMAQLATLPEDQRATLMQVLSLTPDQINSLDPGQRDSIMQLRRQFLGTA